MTTINGTQNNLSPEAVDKASELMHKARQGYCLGQGGSQVLAEDIWARFSMISTKFRTAGDSHMQAITATIQREQNAVVRHEDVPVLQVAGIAGSGKTSVLMQRIAYLFYQHRGALDPTQVFLISPNPVFGRYIDRVLPDLGERNPEILTWEEFLMPLLPAGRGVGESDVSLERLHAIDAAVASFEFTRSDFRDITSAGVRLLAAGEMGIGNTTTSAAVAAVLIRADVRSLVGRGAGLSDASLARKRDVVERAIDANSPDPADPIDVLSKVGGFDIAAMCGFYLGAAASKAPALLDGVISCTAALCAARLCPNALGYLVGTHASSEPASQELLRELGIKAPLDAGMHLCTWQRWSPLGKRAPAASRAIGRCARARGFPPSSARVTWAPQCPGFRAAARFFWRTWATWLRTSFSRKAACPHVTPTLRRARCSEASNGSLRPLSIRWWSPSTCSPMGCATMRGPRHGGARSRA